MYSSNEYVIYTNLIIEIRYVIIEKFNGIENLRQYLFTFIDNLV